jgi:uncharacterized membrane protein
MSTVVATLPGSGGGGPVGTILMVFVLLFVIVGLVVSVRFLLKRIRDSILPSPSNRIEAADGLPDEPSPRPLSVRELKERFMRGQISKADYDEQVRARQLDDYLKGKP